MSYGKHQSFYIKKNWITKGVRAIHDFGPGFFFDVDNYMIIGVGKNMFESIKFWLEASNIVRIIDRKHYLTEFGKYIQNQDPSCSKNFTLLLIHYFLVTDNKPNGVDKLDVFYWFFSQNNEEMLTLARRSSIIEQWSASKKISSNTLKRDFECLVSLYTKSEIIHPEDKNISLLAPLRLINQNNHYIEKNPLDETLYNYHAFMYIILRLANGNRNLNLHTLINDPNSLGRIFNFNSSDIVEIIDTMISSKFKLDFTRTNNINTVSIKETMSADEYLSFVVEKGLV